MMGAIGGRPISADADADMGPESLSARPRVSDSRGSKKKGGFGCIKSFPGFHQRENTDGDGDSDDVFEYKSLCRRIPFCC